jgi:predicted Zn-dependent protease
MRAGALIARWGLAGLLLLLCLACATAPYTGRRQLLMTSQGQETSLGFQAFQQLKKQYPLCTDPQINDQVQRVGKRIADAAARPDFRWEFVVFKEDKEANAFCLPGGKVGIFTGILKYTKDEGGLATVIAHEAAHAISRHAGERMSQGMLQRMGAMGVGVAVAGMSPAAGQAIMTGYDVATQLGIMLPYSRTQEYEADKVGLILLAKAGYDPEVALEFWKRMMAKERGPKPPQFLSTHPKDENRLKALAEFLPEARKYSRPVVEWSGADQPAPRSATATAPAAGQWAPRK